MITKTEAPGSRYRVFSSPCAVNVPVWGLRTHSLNTDSNPSLNELPGNQFPYLHYFRI